jgi:2-polyprenyl-3-methyl-5-hydroxy-6-metoxy-1,4-benzoquinol methylase
MSQQNIDSSVVDLQTIKEYWRDKRVPQQFYSKRKPFTLAWYNDLSFKRYNVYYEYLRRLAEFTEHSGEKILEIGCGVGTDLVEYAKHGAIVSGVDLGDDQIAYTRRNLELRGLRYETLQTANAEELPFADGSFDFVYCFGVIHHSPHPYRIFQEIHRVLAEDGKAIVMVYARGWKHYIKRCFIAGILRGRLFVNGFNWQRVYAEASEVYGNSPKTDVYTKRDVLRLTRDFPNVEVRKVRMGEFFDYAPYGTVQFPRFITNVCTFLGLEALLGENWLIKVHKTPGGPETTLWKVIFKHY